MNFLKSFKVISLFSYQSTFSFFCCRISDSSFNIPRRFRVVNNKFQIFTFYFFGVRQTFHTCINKHISQSMCKCPIMSRVNSISKGKAPQAPPSLVRVPVNSFEFHSCERTPQVDGLEDHGQNFLFIPKHRLHILMKCIQIFLHLSFQRIIPEGKLNICL